MQAYISVDNYLRKQNFPFGTGVVADMTKEEAFRSASCLEGLNTQRQAWQIELPDEDTFLHYEKFMDHQTGKVKDFLSSSKSIEMLYYDEAVDFFKNRLKQITEQNVVIPGTENEVAQQEIKKFIEGKAEEVLSHSTVDSLLCFMKERSYDRNNMDIISSFLFMLGINGIIYTSGDCQKILVFDARRSISLKNAFSMS